MLHCTSIIIILHKDRHILIVDDQILTTYKCFTYAEIYTHSLKLDEESSPRLSISIKIKVGSDAGEHSDLSFLPLLSLIGLIVYYDSIVTEFLTSVTEEIKLKKKKRKENKLKTFQLIYLNFFSIFKNSV